MTTSPEPSAEAAVAEAAVPNDLRTVLLNRVSWGAVLAGVVTALVVQLLLDMLGLGIGLGTLSSAGDNPGATTFSIGAGLWWTLSGIVASFLGGAMAGRLAGRPSASTGGWHGVVAWAATTLVIAYLLTTALGGVLGGAFDVLGNAASAVGRSAASAVPAVAQAGDPFAGIERQVRAATAGNDPAPLRDSVVAYVRGTVTGDQAEAQAARGQAVDALARTANISPEEAGKRVDEWQQQYRQT